MDPQTKLKTLVLMFVLLLAECCWQSFWQLLSREQLFEAEAVKDVFLFNILFRMSQEHLLGVAMLESMWEQITGSQAGNCLLCSIVGVLLVFDFFRFGWDFFLISWSGSISFYIMNFFPAIEVWNKAAGFIWIWSLWVLGLIVFKFRWKGQI